MVEILVGVNVADEAGYSDYRAHMLPILEQHRGAFGIDVRVSEVLRPTDGKRFNRLFTIRFPSLAALDSFFQHPDYLEVRRRYFEPSVTFVEQFGRYECL